MKNFLEKHWQKFAIAIMILAIWICYPMYVKAEVFYRGAHPKGCEGRRENACLHKYEDTKTQTFCYVVHGFTGYGSAPAISCVRYRVEKKDDL